jgi:hypothetical protein
MCNVSRRSHQEIVFRRALALANVREEVTVEKVLACPIGQIPTALFHDDKNMIFWRKIVIFSHEIPQNFSRFPPQLEKI